MNSLKRPALALGAAALMTASLTACGGASGAPKDASKADFCKAYQSQDDALEKIGDADYDGLAKSMHRFGDEMQKTGTPKGISDDARAGFEVTVEAASKADAGKIKDAVKKLQSSAASDEPSDAEVGAKVFGISSSDMKKTEAFDKYAADTCS